MPIREVDTTKVPGRGPQWARVGIAGPQSSGKTRTALWLAFQLGEKVLVLDTELAGPATSGRGEPRGSAELFAEHYPRFAHKLWEPPFDPADLGDTIQHYAWSYDVIIVDSLSHFWNSTGGTLQIVDEASRRYGGHEGAGWADGTPIQDSMVRAIQTAPCHIILCMRSKTLWNMTGGSMKPIGAGEQQRPGFAYELNLAMHLDREHEIEIAKSRVDGGGITIPVGKRYPLKDHGRFADDFRTWLGGPVRPDRATPDDLAEVTALFSAWPEGRARNVQKIAFLERYGINEPGELLAADVDDARSWLESEAPTKPKAKARKPRRAAQSRSEAPHRVDLDDLPSEEPGDAHSGSDPLSPREEIRSILVEVPGPVSLEIENVLVEAGLWPISKVPDDKIEEALSAARLIRDEHEGETE